MSDSNKVINAKNSQLGKEEKIFKVGVIGLGKMGQIRAEHILGHPQMKLVAVSDVDLQKSELFPNAEFYKDYKNLLAEALDIVFVAAYNHIAPHAVIRALSAGMHVFCEKPPGRTVEDVEAVIQAEARNPGLILKYGFNHRYHYAIMEAKSMVDSGQYGKILWLRGVYGKSGGTAYEKAWRNDSRLAGGGILLDQGIHMVDLFRYFCGEFEEVKSFTTTSYWDIPLEDNAFAILRNTHNQIAMLHSSATQWKHKFLLELGLEDGYININGILSSTRSYGEESITFARRQFEDEASAFGKPREQTIYFDRDDSWRLEIEDFVNAIVGKRRVETGTSKDALKVMQLVRKIYHQSLI